MHPEVDGPLGEALKEVMNMELVDVFCNGCQGFVKMNSNYAQYLDGEIESCSHCNPKIQAAKRALGR